MKKMQHCFNCGKELGVYESYSGDIEHCGEKECRQEAQNIYRERNEAAQKAAQEDNYDRYR